MISLPPDDLDEMLFESGETKSDNIVEDQSSPKQAHRMSNKRRAWLWKNPMHNSFDDTDIVSADRHQVPGIVAPPSSVENSRRESICSSQSSPNRASPKRNREYKNKKDGEKSKRKDSIKETNKDRSDQIPQSSSYHDPSKPNVAQRLYRVLEEQALGEAVCKLSGVAAKNKQQQQPVNLCAPEDLPTNNRYSY